MHNFEKTIQNEIRSSIVNAAERIAQKDSKLKSASKLPFDRAIMGGLNIRFGSVIPTKKLIALLQTYFQNSEFRAS